jgi:hypothetical protein
MTTPPVDDAPPARRYVRRSTSVSTRSAGAATNTRGQSASGSPADIAVALRLGWRMAQVYHSPPPRDPPKDEFMVQSPIVRHNRREGHTTLSQISASIRPAFGVPSPVTISYPGPAS